MAWPTTHTASAPPPRPSRPGRRDSPNPATALEPARERVAQRVRLHKRNGEPRAGPVRARTHRPPAATLRVASRVRQPATRPRRRDDRHLAVPAAVPPCLVNGLAEILHCKYPRSHATALGDGRFGVQRRGHPAGPCRPGVHAGRRRRCGLQRDETSSSAAYGAARRGGAASQRLPDRDQLRQACRFRFGFPRPAHWRGSRGERNGGGRAHHHRGALAEERRMRKPEFLGFSQVAEQLEKRFDHAGFVVASYPVAAIADASRIGDIRLIPEAHDVSSHPGRNRSCVPPPSPAAPTATTRADSETLARTCCSYPVRTCRKSSLISPRRTCSRESRSWRRARRRPPHRSPRRDRRRRFRCTRAPPGTIASASCCNYRQGPRRARRVRVADGFPWRRCVGRRQHAGARVRRPDCVVDAVWRGEAFAVSFDHSAEKCRRATHDRVAATIASSRCPRRFPDRRGDALVVDRRLSRDSQRATATRSSRPGPCRTFT